jgi:hypothetical protein
VQVLVDIRTIEKRIIKKKRIFSLKNVPVPESKIRYPEKNSSWIGMPDPGGKKVLDPGSGSATLV